MFYIDNLVFLNILFLITIKFSTSLWIQIPKVSYLREKINNEKYSTTYDSVSGRRYFIKTRYRYVNTRPELVVTERCMKRYDTELVSSVDDQRSPVYTFLVICTVGLLGIPFFPFLLEQITNFDLSTTERSNYIIGFLLSKRIYLYAWGFITLTLIESRMRLGKA